MRKLGASADLGNAVALLCSAEASWITGQILDVDGGASLMDAHLPPGNPATTRCKRRPHRLAEQLSKTRQSHVSQRRSRPPSFRPPWGILHSRAGWLSFANQASDSRYPCG